MAYRTGDVLLVTYPYTDLTTTKARPAVVVRDVVQPMHGFVNFVLKPVTFRAVALLAVEASLRAAHRRVTWACWLMLDVDVKECYVLLSRVVG